MRPVVDISMPAALAGQTNGKLDGWVLAEADELGHLLETNAARAWKHMVAAAWLDNVFLTVDNSYRSYAEQVNLFTARYSRTWQTTNPVYWDGNPWWRLPGAITAAVPGTSNHGWGLAVDVHTDATNVRWLEQHEVEFGWSHEAGISESEPWHVHYFAGDIEQTEVDDMTPQQLCAALGPTAELGLDGVIRIPLINDDLQGHTPYPVADVLTFVHQELKMKRLLG